MGGPRGAIASTLGAADFEVADFEVADFEVADFEVADFEVADFEVADFEVADFEVADFELADSELADGCTRGIESEIEAAESGLRGVVRISNVADCAGLGAWVGGFWGE